MGSAMAMTSLLFRRKNQPSELCCCSDQPGGPVSPHHPRPAGPSGQGRHLWILHGDEYGMQPYDHLGGSLDVDSVHQAQQDWGDEVIEDQQTGPNCNTIPRAIFSEKQGSHNHGRTQTHFQKIR